MNIIQNRVLAGSRPLFEMAIDKKLMSKIGKQTFYICESSIQIIELIFSS